METEKLTLEEIRARIDVIDSEMKQLFLSRMEMSDAVALLKAESGDPVYRPEREKAMLDRLAVDVEPRFQNSYIRFLKEILDISKEYQQDKLSRLKSQKQ
ncbi:MAG: chorismate mutase [Eubacterium sp.]|nr:chorismate mutase [Eubacterium sp.]